MSSPARVHDPLFHFETHFPERLSRLHLNPEYGNHPIQRKSRKSRAARQGIRYKTQPVTFDEIQEVDEENDKEEEKDKVDGIRNQFAAFSKSMDGLLPKQKKKTSDSIDENVAVESCHPKTIKSNIAEIGRVQSAELRLTEADEENKENKENEPNENSNAETSRQVSGLPPSGPNMQRRQRTTAKAKKRQIQAEAEGGGDKGT